VSQQGRAHPHTNKRRQGLEKRDHRGFILQDGKLKKKVGRTTRKFFQGSVKREKRNSNKKEKGMSERSREGKENQVGQTTLTKRKANQRKKGITKRGCK